MFYEGGFCFCFCLFLIRIGLIWKFQLNEMSVVIYDFHFDQLLTFWVTCTLTRKTLSARIGELVTQFKSKGEAVNEAVIGSKGIKGIV